MKLKNNRDFYFLNCLHSFTKKQTWITQKVCQNKDFCNVIMFSQDNKTLEFDQYQQSHQAPFIIYKDLQCNIEKIDG